MQFQLFTSRVISEYSVRTCMILLGLDVQGHGVKSCMLLHCYLVGAVLDMEDHSISSVSVEAVQQTQQELTHQRTHSKQQADFYTNVCCVKHLQVRKPLMPLFLWVTSRDGSGPLPNFEPVFPVSSRKKVVPEWQRGSLLDQTEQIAYVKGCGRVYCEQTKPTTMSTLLLILLLLIFSNAKHGREAAALVCWGDKLSSRPVIETSSKELSTCTEALWFFLN